MPPSGAGNKSRVGIGRRESSLGEQLAQHHEQRRREWSGSVSPLSTSGARRRGRPGDHRSAVRRPSAFLGATRRLDTQTRALAPAEPERRPEVRHGASAGPSDSASSCSSSASTTCAVRFHCWQPDATARAPCDVVGGHRRGQDRPEYAVVPLDGPRCVPPDPALHQRLNVLRRDRTDLPPSERRKNAHGQCLHRLRTPMVACPAGRARLQPDAPKVVADERGSTHAPRSTSPSTILRYRSASPRRANHRWRSLPSGHGTGRRIASRLSASAASSRAPRHRPPMGTLPGT